ncbi:MAG: hypothetical protein K2X47_05345, partial [Bdellovibrionales bacterium]|nr:hypothetical protein [Bdellovibrionales bacterium]
GEVEYIRYRNRSVLLGHAITFGICRARRGPERPHTIHYFFHGGNGNDRQFVDGDFHLTISQALKEKILSEGAIFILPDIGTSFLLDPAKGRENYYEFFFREFVPAIEARFAEKSIKRFVSGMSMGGFAALNAFLKNPGFFQGVTAIAPSLLPFDFYDSDQLSQFQKKYRVPDVLMELVTNLIKANFLSYDDYQKADPLQLMKLEAPRLDQRAFVHLSVGKLDELGSQEGVQKLHLLMNELEVEHEYLVLSEGRHDLPTFQKAFLDSILKLHSFQLRHQGFYPPFQSKRVEKQGSALSE